MSTMCRLERAVTVFDSILPGHGLCEQRRDSAEEAIKSNLLATSRLALVWVGRWDSTRKHNLKPNYNTEVLPTKRTCILLDF
mmetsp:Transcript_21058/g.58316  ORF Transcript_21058/g.58316 Transcript_21058/m.58316 type:complete len:82 (-) Transcript_21058:62-307(-)